MATLAELLSLLPDNDTGAIDAEDLRTIVTDLYGKTLAVVAVSVGNESRVDAPVNLWLDSRVAPANPPPEFDLDSDIWLKQT